MNTTNYTKTFKEFPFITTQSTFNTSIKKNKSKKKISRNLNSLRNKMNLSNTFHLNTYSERNNFTNYNLNYLNKDEDNNNEDIINSHLIKEDLIDNKKKQIRLKKECILNYINKTRDILLMNYTIGIKKERAIRIKEKYRNKIEGIENLSNSIEKANTLFNNQFLIKFNDYIKELEIQKEIEKTLNTNLEEETLKLKNEISIIETKILKVEHEKNMIIRWIFFQISLKEKKLILPIYYKYIIEETEENIKKIFDNPYNFKEDEKIKIYERTKQIRKNSIRRTIRKNTAGSFYENKSNTQKNEININIYKNISFKEAQRIRNYKYQLCFSNPDELIDTIKKYENKNIKLIEYYNDLNNYIFQLKKEKEEIEKEKEKEILSELEILKEKEFDLNIQKSKYDILLKEFVMLKNNKKNQNENNKKKITKKNIFDKYKKSSFNLNLYENILKIYNTCSKVINEAINPEFIVIRKIKTKEEEILYKLSQIEIVIDYLTNIMDIYFKDKIRFYEIKRIINNIDRHRKTENTKKQREEEKNKLIKLREKIEKRDNKIYFLPYKKTDNYSEFLIKKEVKNLNDYSFYNNPKIEDFMYDNKDEKNENNNMNNK